MKELISLKEFLTEKIENLKEVTNLKFDKTEQALQLEATELARRLEILNGEASRLREIQSTYLPRELFEANFNEINKSFVEVNKKIVELELARSEMQGRGQVYTTVVSTTISIGIGLLFLLLNWLIRK